MEDEPAFPQSLASEGPFGGLTKREWFAGMALIGILSDPARTRLKHSMDSREIATHAGAFADAMLAELARKEGEG